MKTKSKLTVLQTVYPPISSSMASILKNDKEVEALFRKSDFYMIAARPEARFRDVAVDAKEAILDLTIAMHGHDPVPVTIKISELPGVEAFKGETYQLEVDQEGTGFRIWSGTPHGEGSEVLEWFTPDSLLWYASRGRPGIYGLDGDHELSKFELLYIGIAKKGDSFGRLINKGHEKRMEILSSEPQRGPGARVSDEIILFLFAAVPTFVTTIENEDDIDDDLIFGTYDNKRIVIDAEKAFVKLLEPHYNEELFKNYPKGRDGLYAQGFTRYAYVIGEDVEFVTPNGTIRGAYGLEGLPDNKADAILVEGDVVSLKSADKL